MKPLINIYCDESCHLEAKKIDASNRYMVIGGISCPAEQRSGVFKRISQIKTENKLPSYSEVKWTKVSNKNVDCYRDLINYFFDQNDLSFRGVSVDKEQLRHKEFKQTHDEFYYKMYWLMLEWFIEPSNRYHIYLDIKDTQGAEKIQKLHEVLSNSQHDFDRHIIQRIQEVRSHEIALLQIADILIAAVSYACRYPSGGESKAKNDLVELVKSRSWSSLKRSTTLGARKFNLLQWTS